MGSKKSSSTTNTSQQTHLTTTPTNPEWVTSGLGGLGGALTDLGKADPYSFVAGPDPLQTQAAGGAAALGGSPWNFNGAADLIRGVAAGGANTYDPSHATSASLLDNLSAYYNPFKDQIINPVLSDFDQQAGKTRAQQALDLAGDTTFGGSGGSILRAQTEDNLARGRASTLGGLLNDMFTTSTGLAGQDAARRQETSIFNAGADNTAGAFNANQRDAEMQRRLDAAKGLVDTSTAYDANNRANIGTQASIGSILQALAQQRAGAPLALTGALADIWKTLPLDLLHGQTADGTMTGTSNSTGKESGATLGDWLNYFAANAQAAAAAGG